MLICVCFIGLLSVTKFALFINPHCHKLHIHSFDLQLHKVSHIDIYFKRWLPSCFTLYDASSTPDPANTLVLLKITSGNGKGTKTGKEEQTPSNLQTESHTNKLEFDENMYREGHTTLKGK